MWGYALQNSCRFRNFIVRLDVTKIFFKFDKFNNILLSYQNMLAAVQICRNIRSLDFNDIVILFFYINLVNVSSFVANLIINGNVLLRLKYLSIK